MFAIAADVVMGLILGLFIYAAVVRIWPAAAGIYVGVAIFAASLLVVSLRRPNGSLARSNERSRTR